MGAMLYLFGKIVWIYVLNPEIVRAIKIPPIMPLIPYLPQAFKLNFLPPFYFVYWILIIAIIAIVHEFAHGIFASRKGVGIKNTGFGFFPFFLPIFLAAFVELDEDKMKKKSIFSQMSVLAAGTFANVMTGILFFGLMWLFFSLAFVPAGVNFDAYTYSMVDVGNITSVGGVDFEGGTYESLYNLVAEDGLVKVMVGEGSFVVTRGFLDVQQNNLNYVLLYDDAPAVNAGLDGAITKINGVGIGSKEELGEELSGYSPGDAITVTTVVNEDVKTHNLVLGEHPDNENVGFLGIGFANQEASGGLLGRVVSALSSLKKPHTYYESKFEAGIFIYNLLWWLVLISFSVALVNMLPVGIFDGGRFFYLTVLALTGKEKIAKGAFSIMTKLFLVLLVVIMIFWAKSFFG